MPRPAKAAAPKTKSKTPFEHLGRPIEELISSVNRSNSNGGARLVTGADLPKDIPRFSSGSIALDLDLGGGWKRANMHHIRGAYSSLKTTLALLAITEMQKRCHFCNELIKSCTCGAKVPGMCAFIAMEAYDEQRSARLGVNDDLLVLSQPENGEDAVDLINKIIRCGQVSTIVLDSVAALMPKELVEKEAKDSKSPGNLARLMSYAVNKWQKALNLKVPHPVQRICPNPAKPKEWIPAPWPNLCSIILLNQKRHSIGPTAAPPPGGEFMMHACGSAVQLYSAPSNYTYEGGDDEGPKIGSYATQQDGLYFTEKNKTWFPKRHGVLRYDVLNQRIDNEWSYFQYAKRWGLIEKGGSWYSFGGQKVQGEDKAIDLFCRNDVALYQELKAVVDERFVEVLKTGRL